MTYIDPHIHMISRTTDDYERMAQAGCVAVTEPAFWAGFDRSSPQGFYNYFCQLTDFEPKRAAEYGIRHFCWLCINPKEAEDPVFAERLASEGICFLGPSADALHVLGDKIAAKRLAESAKVPVLPWNGAAVADPEEARIAAEEIGYPVVIKARTGGGGRGIRIVDEPGALSEAFRSAAAEVQASFGDGGLFLEKRIESGRHVEVQIAGDRGGVVLALGRALPAHAVR